MITNQLFASASSAVYQTMAMRQADAAARSEFLAARSKVGKDTSVIALPEYTIGPDGIRYLTGGSLTTIKRTGDKPQQSGLSAIAGQLENLKPSQDNDELAVRSGRVRTRPATLADILSNLIAPSPLEFAQAFGEEFNDDLVRGKFQTVDRGVRSQEQQHYRAAGGLVTNTPRYNTQEGPEGILYAISGEVRVHPSSLAGPSKAAREAATAALAATAPGDASAQDFAVARASYAKSAAFWQQAFAPPSTVNLLE